MASKTRQARKIPARKESALAQQESGSTQTNTPEQTNARRGTRANPTETSPTPSDNPPSPPKEPTEVPQQRKRVGKRKQQEEEQAARDEEARRLELVEKAKLLEEKEKANEEERKRLEQQAKDMQKMKEELAEMRAMLAAQKAAPLVQPALTPPHPRPPPSSHSFSEQSSFPLHSDNIWPSSPPDSFCQKSSPPQNLSFGGASDSLQDYSYSTDEELDDRQSTITGTSVDTAMVNMMSLRKSSTLPTYNEQVRLTPHLSSLRSLEPRGSTSSRASTPASTARQHWSNAAATPSDISQGELPVFSTSVSNNHTLPSTATTKANTGRKEKKPRATRSLKEILTPTQYRIYGKMESHLWEYILFSNPFINTTANSTEIIKIFKAKWFDVAKNTNMTEPATFDTNVIFAVCTSLSPLYLQS